MSKKMKKDGSSKKTKSKKTEETPSSNTPSKVNLAERIETLEQQLENMKEDLLRKQAEFENYRKRTIKEKEDMLDTASFDVFKQLLPILDNFERAIHVEIEQNHASFIDGFKMIYKELDDLFKSYFISSLGEVGEVFDPMKHQAIQFEESNKTDVELVSEIYQKGYQMKEKILRLSMVKIKKPKNN